MLNRYRYLAKRAAFALWEKSTPSYRIVIESGEVNIPGNTISGLNLCKKWRPGWKTQLMGYFLTKNGIMVDVGTNIGQTFVDYCFLGRGGAYVGFEPSPSCVQAMRGIIRVNPKHDAQIIPVALSSKNGLVSLYFGDGDETDAAATLDKDVRPRKKNSSVLVPCARFDDVLPDLALAGIDLIKIDVEGAELHVLQGMHGCLKSRRPPLMCEVLHRDPHAEEAAYLQTISSLSSLLGSIEYKVFQIVVNGDASSAVGLRALDEFPNAVFRPQSHNECDYLFLPAEMSPPKGLKLIE